MHLIGRLTQDVELRERGETKVAQLRLAVPRGRDKNGEDRGADFVDVVCFGRQAEVAAEYLAKGRRIAVEGPCTTTSGTARTAAARSSRSSPRASSSRRLARPTASPPNRRSPSPRSAHGAMAGRPAKGRPASPLNPKESVMQQHTSTTADARVQIGSLWIDRAHHHRLVEVIQVPDERARPRPAGPRVAPPAAELSRGRRATRKRLRAGAAMTSSTPQSEERAARDASAPSDAPARRRPRRTPAAALR